MRRKTDDAARFWARVTKTETCWRGPLTASLDGVQENAHRVAWRLLRDPAAIEGRILIRSCSTKRCVNPDHMALALGAEDHARIRKMARDGATHDAIARTFGVSRPRITHILNAGGAA